MQSTKSRRWRPSRRQFLKGAGTALAAAAGPTIIVKSGRTARAEAVPGTIRLLGGATIALEDWSQFEADTGLKMEFHEFHVDDVGALYNEVKVNEIGERVDIMQALAGVHKGLVADDWVMQLDGAKMSNYAGIPEGVRRNPLLYSGDDKDWGIPIYMNSDTFGYFPTKLNKPRPPDELNWDLLLNSEETLGASALDGDYLSLMWAGMYLKTRNLAEIADPANMTESEVKAAADFLIERKQAGQFRTLWANYDEQVANFVNGEVLVQRCWEPAVREVRRQGVDVEYAYCDDFYIHWMQAAFIPIQAQERENLDEIYRALNWFLDGPYAAKLAVLRGYAASRPDLGLEWATAQGWKDEELGLVQENLNKIDKKMSNPNFWITGLPDTLEAHENEMARFKNA